jgi:hypothetical protein
VTTAQYQWDQSWIRITAIEIDNVLTFYTWESWHRRTKLIDPWRGAWVEVDL